MQKNDHSQVGYTQEQINKFMEMHTLVVDKEAMQALRDEVKWLREVIANLRKEIDNLQAEKLPMATCAACHEDFPHNKVMWVANRYECEWCYERLSI